MSNRLITVFGGSGFVGRHLVARLAATGARVRVAVRRPEKALFLCPMGDVGQVELVQANVRDDASVARAVAGADAVVDLVGILAEAGPQKFTAVHAEGAGRIARAATAAGAKTMVYLSSLGADEKSTSAYARSKAAGEAAVRDAFPGAVILRSSLVVGPQDNFFNLFAGLARLLPVLPLIGGGKTKFQPVYVGDLAGALMAASGSQDVAGQTFEIGGPEVFSFRQLLEMMMEVTGQRCLLVPLPFFVARLNGWWFQFFSTLSLGIFAPLLTVDQVEQLKSDNVVTEGMPGLAALGLEATPIGPLLPGYLKRFRPSGQFEPQT